MMKTEWPWERADRSGDASEWPDTYRWGTTTIQTGRKEDATLRNTSTVVVAEGVHATRCGQSKALRRSRIALTPHF